MFPRHVHDESLQQAKRQLNTYGISGNASYKAGLLSSLLSSLPSNTFHHRLLAKPVTTPPNVRIFRVIIYLPKLISSAIALRPLLTSVAQSAQASHTSTNHRLKPALGNSRKLVRSWFGYVMICCFLFFFSNVCLESWGLTARCYLQQFGRPVCNPLDLHPLHLQLMSAVGASKF